MQYDVWTQFNAHQIQWRRESVDSWRESAAFWLAHNGRYCNERMTSLARIGALQRQLRKITGEMIAKGV